MTTRTFADNTRRPIINTVTIVMRSLHHTGVITAALLSISSGVYNDLDSDMFSLLLTINECL